jgi:hypothetical protein
VCLPIPPQRFVQLLPAHHFIFKNFRKQKATWQWGLACEDLHLFPAFAETLPRRGAIPDNDRDQLYGIPKILNNTFQRTISIFINPSPERTLRGKGPPTTIRFV